MNIFNLVSFILKPQKAIDYANKFRLDPYTIGYLNEFFSKYLAFGKSNKEIIDINEKIDRHIKTGNKIADTLIELRKIRLELKKLDKNKDDQLITTKRTFGISQGIANGVALNIINTKQIIPKNCIGIFPTSGTKYTTQFLKCIGIVFLNGGVTSHGAILAREHNIPAIVSPNLKISDGKNILIDGGSGEINR